MKNFQIFRYLKKWTSLIAVFFVVMTVIACLILPTRQQYVATAVIRYNNPEAVDGLAPDDSPIDVTEINSTDNLAKVMENLGLDPDEYSVDSLCASISTVPVYEEEEEAVKLALNEQGETYQKKPTEYLITCTMGYEAGEDFARNILNELLDVYFAKYSSEHINKQQLSNKIKGLVVQNLDYLEVVEKIETDLNSTMERLDNYNKRDSEFRSSQTGYSFQNLWRQFSLLYDVNLYRLYSLILGNQVTKDKALLLNRYENSIAEYQLDGQKAEDDVSQSERIINAYVDKLRDSGNADIDYNYILDDVYDEWYTQQSSTSADGTSTTETKRIDRSVEYDTLLTNWVKAKDRYDYSTVDRAYCEYILGIYRNGKSVQASSGNTASIAKSDDSDQPLADQAETEAEGAVVPDAVVLSKSSSSEEIEKEINTILERMNQLYEIADITIAEYNEYLGAENIQTLSSVSASQSMNVKLYLMIIAFFFLLLGCFGAILIGRIGDILEYVFLKDHQTGCMNRVSCDNYINRQSRQVMTAAFCCVNLQILNQREINRDLGREEADKILSQIGKMLREVYENQSQSFVGYNGSGQFWIFYENAEGEHIEEGIERLTILLRDLFSFYPVTYAVSGVNAGELGDYQIRSLISRAVAGRRTYVTAEVKPGEEMNQKSVR